MAIYNYKKELKLYIVQNGLRYSLDIYPDISFSQTLSETAVPVKTLHSQRDMFENAVITRANPANFNFTIPILLEKDMDVVLSTLMDYDNTSSEATIKTADLYVEMNSEVHKLEKAVIESGTFRIANRDIITLTVSGTAKKLSKYIGAIPGTLQPRSGYTTYSSPTILEIKLDGVTQSSISAVSLELKNEVSWVDFSTLHNSLVINSASGTQFPEAFVVSSRTLSGTIEQYTTDETTGNPVDWNIGSTLRIRTGNINASWLLDVNIPSIVYTKRVELQDFLMQSYDFRMNTNVADLSTVITHFHTPYNLGYYSGIWAAI